MNGPAPAGAAHRHRASTAGWLPGQRWRARRRQARLFPAARSRDRASGRAHRSRRVATLAAVLSGVVFLAVGGPVAAVLAATYSALTVSAVLRRRLARRHAEASGAALDAVVGLAADLRAGVTPALAVAAAAPALPIGGPPIPSSVPAMAAPEVVTGRPEAGHVLPADRAPEEVRRLATRVRSAWQVAETTGAPLADLLDRLDADARTAARVRQVAASHAAGTWATAWLLAAMPVAGIAIGYGMGADPLHVLLHTALGAACAGAALAFQIGGLAWTARLARVAVTSP